MKKMFSILTIIVLLWAILMFVDYVRAYNNGEKLLVTVNLEVTDKYTKQTGLGYIITNYAYDKDNLHDGQVLKDFSIFGLVVSKEVVATHNES